MTYYLRKGVYAAMIDEAVVLLDLAGDSYLCLPAGAASLKRQTDGAVRILDADLATRLQAAGLTSPQPPGPGASPPARPTRTVIHEPAALAWADLWPAARAAAAQRSVRAGAGVTAHLLDRRGLRRDKPAVARAAGAFWRLSPWLPVEGECLVRSGLLIRFLTRLGLHADWVFGVRLYPFMAHCWVQIDDLCLNDDVERLAAYTPLARL